MKTDNYKRGPTIHTTPLHTRTHVHTHLIQFALHVLLQLLCCTVDFLQCRLIGKAQSLEVLRVLLCTLQLGLNGQLGCLQVI